MGFIRHLNQTRRRQLATSLGIPGVQADVQPDTIIDYLCAASFVHTLDAPRETLKPAYVKELNAHCMKESERW
eukprot:m.350849 g.350849  ORF g.350849 m.350849 type:complete len:73 (+) comp16160_c0_seq7:3174-3392(+)